MTNHPLNLDRAITESEVEARIRLGRAPTATQLRAGAAIHGVYHPPVQPWEGHAEDVVFDAGALGDRRWVWLQIIGWAFAAVCILAFAVYG